MAKYYNHRQIGYLLMTSMGAAMIFIAFTMVSLGFHWVPLLVLVILGTAMILFATLNITIDDEYLEVRFGLGLIRKKLSLKDIESQYPVKNPWYFGWGIHLTPHGWLYNVSGFYAIKLNMKNGKKYLIGTDEPKTLTEALHKSIDRLNSQE